MTNNIVEVDMERIPFVKDLAANGTCMILSFLNFASGYRHFFDDQAPSNSCSCYKRDRLLY